MYWRRACGHWSWATLMLTSGPDRTAISLGSFPKAEQYCYDCLRRMVIGCAGCGKAIFPYDSIAVGLLSVPSKLGVRVCAYSDGQWSMANVLNNGGTTLLTVRTDAYGPVDDDYIGCFVGCTGCLTAMKAVEWLSTDEKGRTRQGSYYWWPQVGGLGMPGVWVYPPRPRQPAA